MAAVPTRDPRTDRARFLTCVTAMVVAPLLLTIGAFLSVSTGDKAVQEVTDIAADRNRFLLSGIFAALGAAGLIPAALGLGRLVRGRGGAWMTTAVCMIALGGGCFAIGLWTYTAVGFIGTTKGVPRDGIVALFDKANDSFVTGLPWILAIGALIGFIVAGIALLRARAVPKWEAILLIIGPIAVFFSGNGPVGGLFSIPLTVALCALAYEAATMPREALVPADTAPGVIDLNAMPGQRERVEPVVTKEPTS